MSKSSGRAWPYAIGAAITLVFGFCVATIVVTAQAPVEKSNDYMMDYQDADATANEIIKAQIEFEKRYNVEYISDKISLDSTTLKYKITDKNSKAVNSARIKVVITRPTTDKYDQELKEFNVENGIYTFKGIKLPLEGRWNIIAKITVDNAEKFYNIKADTRKKEVKEY